MRLDHLLSKEQFEAETRRAHPKVDRGSPEGRKRKRTCEEHRLSLKNLLAVSFSGSSLEKRFSAAKLVWGFSSVGRAPALQAGGQRFDPANLHAYGSLAQPVRALA